MTDEKVIELAKQAGWKELPTVRLAFAGFELQRFAQLVRNEVLEECAEYCEARFSDGAADIADGLRGMKS